MTPALLRAARLQAQRLTAPAASVVAAAEHMLAVQAQEFWAARWALAARSIGSPTLSQVDRLFQEGKLVRSWTQRGTLHVIPAADLRWVLSVTAERQLRMAAPRHRELGLDDDVFSRAERVVRTALSGGNALTRTEIFALLAAAGIDPTAQRGVFILQYLSLRGVIVQGPVMPHPRGTTRDQGFVLVEEHVVNEHHPEDALSELFVRFITGHGPASADDFAWWAGLPITVARRAASDSAVRVEESEPGLFRALRRPRRSRTPSVIALGMFEEYYIPYRDRTVACPADYLAVVGPAKNGMVRSIVLNEGVVAGCWTHSTAVGRSGASPTAELFDPGSISDEDVADALTRYADFITG